MPVPVPTGAVNAAEAAARDLARTAPSQGGILAQVEELLSVSGESAGVAAVASADTGAVSAGVVAGEAAASTGVLPVILTVLLVLLILRFMEGVFIWLAGKIPLVGSGAAGLVRNSFRWLDNLENAVLAFMGAQIQKLLHAFVQLVGWCVQELGFFIPSAQPAPRAQPGKVATEQEIYNLQQQINQLRAEMSSLNYALTPSPPIPSYGTPAPAPVTNVSNVTRVVTVGVPQKVWDEIHALQDTQAQFRRDLNNFKVQLDTTTATTARTAQEQQELSTSIHSIRAVATGWQDVEQRVTYLGQLINAYADQVDAELQRQDQVQRQMEPLTLLLAPGIAGLKTLRQLEDTPCMCPKLPNIPRLAPELLAAYGFATYG